MKRRKKKYKMHCKNTKSRDPINEFVTSKKFITTLHKNLRFVEDLKNLNDMITKTNYSTNGKRTDVLSVYEY